MTRPPEKHKKREKRCVQPDLDQVASATEYTGILPAQREDADGPAESLT